MRFSAILILVGYYVVAISCQNSEDSGYFLVKRPERDRYSFGLGRRAYTYSSGGPGIKRLPVYNFGLGKRDRLVKDDNEANYAPERRSALRYNFGLGKRADSFSNDDQKFAKFSDEYPSEKKSALRYNFGLGKRGDSFSNANPEPQSSKFTIEFPSEKKSALRYNFGLGKRDNSFLSNYEPDTSNFAFSAETSDADNMNKRKKRSALRYNFGLGKRDSSFADQAEDVQKGEDGISDWDTIGKRFAPERRSALRYNFGLGKRDNSFARPVGSDYNSEEKRQRYSFGLGKRFVNSYAANNDLGLSRSSFVNENVYDGEKGFEPEKKAALRYNFGLGKRDSALINRFDDAKEFNEATSLNSPSINEVKRYIINDTPERRSARYNFGLGKR